MKMLLNRGNILRASFYRDYPHGLRNRAVSHMFYSRAIAPNARESGFATSTIHLGFFDYDASISFGFGCPSRLKEDSYFSFYYHLHEKAFGF